MFSFFFGGGEEEAGGDITPSRPGLHSPAPLPPKKNKNKDKVVQKHHNHSECCLELLVVVYVKFRYHFQDNRTKGFSVNSASIKGCKVSPEKNPRQWQRCKDERQSYSLDETSLLHDKNCGKMLPK